jgi:predicted nucleotidyltransferase
MEKLLEPIRSILRQHPNIKLCILFGSAAAGRASANSDLDIAVAAQQPLSGDEYLELMAAFSSATHREIDLLDLLSATGEILKQALSKGVIIQNLDKELCARQISRMLFNQADMMPYHDRILRERRERFLSQHNETIKS